MTSSVRVHMRVCSRTTKVTAELQDDKDTIRITIATDCFNVKSYTELLGSEIHVSDVVDWATSRVVDSDIRQPLTISCLVPIAIFNAAAMEIGMLSKSLARNAKSNDIEFIGDDERFPSSPIKTDAPVPSRTRTKSRRSHPTPRASGRERADIWTSPYQERGPQQKRRWPPGPFLHHGMSAQSRQDQTASVHGVATPWVCQNLSLSAGGWLWDTGPLGHKVAIGAGRDTPFSYYGRS